MKKIVLLFCICLSMSTIAQDKKVAMLETIVTDPEISSLIQNMVRGELTKSISLQPGFSAFTRSDIDQMINEINFQSSGIVNDDQIAELGEMSGADFICISKVSKDGESYYIEASLINIETGQIENKATDFVESGGISVVNKSCQKIAKELVGSDVAMKDSTKTTQRKDIAYISIVQLNIANPVTATLGEKKIVGASKIRKIISQCPEAVLLFDEALLILKRETKSFEMLQKNIMIIYNHFDNKNNLRSTIIG